MNIDSSRSMGLILIFLTAAIAIGGCSSGVRVELPGSDESGPRMNPLNATYRIEGDDIRLRDGYFERTAAPGSAAKVTVAIFDAPVYGDLNNDGVADAAMLLVYQGGGSGTFYYAAASINEAGSLKGTNTVFLGDRIIPQAIAIENRQIVASILDRGPDDAMASMPSRDVKVYVYMKGDRLVAVPPETEVSGWVTIGHEVRSLRLCGERAEYWLSGRSPALSDIEKSYRATTTDGRPYTPIFMALSGSVLDPPEDGFGKDYEQAFFATALNATNDMRHCREEFVVVREPEPGAVIDSPLAITGRALGSWFFEGDFPVVLEDAAGNTIATGFVSAQGDWMTRTFVPFAGTLSFTRPAPGDFGWLIFKKDNPSEKRELDDAMSIPVFFR